jgi:hypothetical protein
MWLFADGSRQARGTSAAISRRPSQCSIVGRSLSRAQKIRMQVTYTKWATVAPARFAVSMLNWTDIAAPRQRSHLPV